MESVKCRWIASEAVEEYLEVSRFRFEEIEEQADLRQVKLFEQGDTDAHDGSCPLTMSFRFVHDR